MQSARPNGRTGAAARAAAAPRMHLAAGAGSLTTRPWAFYGDHGTVKQPGGTGSFHPEDTHRLR
jgi:hypothetical protein